MYQLTQKTSFWLILSLFIFSNSELDAQSWQSALQLGNGNSRGVQVVDTWGSSTFLAISFANDFPIGNTNLISKGEEDLLIAELKEDEIRPLLLGGSERGDFIDDMEVDLDGNIFLVGSFWSKIDFGNFILETKPESPKGLFLIKIDQQGNLIWGQVLEGGTNKSINDLCVVSDAKVLIGGYFGKELSFADTSLQADGRSSAFMAQFNTENGQLDWTQGFGHTGNTRISALSSAGEERLYASGYFDDTLSIAGETFPANTNDQDVFLLSLSEKGDIKWVRKAGGVFEEEPSAMVSDELGNSYTAGRLVGVMKLNDSLSIQSRDGNADFFLIKYDQSGNAIWARSFGGDQLQSIDDLVYAQGDLWICGSFQENLKMGDFELKASASFDGFFSQLDINGQVLRLEGLASENGSVLPRSLHEEGSSILLAGDFSGSLNLGDFTLSATPFAFNVFLAVWDTLITPIERWTNDQGILVFPNPFKDELKVESLEGKINIKVTSIDGRIVYQSKRIQTSINTQAWPPGTYVLSIEYQGQTFISKLVKQ